MTGSRTRQDTSQLCREQVFQVQNLWRRLAPLPPLHDEAVPKDGIADAPGCCVLSGPTELTRQSQGTDCGLQVLQVPSPCAHQSPQFPRTDQGYREGLDEPFIELTAAPWQNGVARYIGRQ